MRLKEVAFTARDLTTRCQVFSTLTTFEASVMCWPPKQELKRTITGLGVAWAQGNSSYCCLSFVVVFSHSVVSDSL